MNLDILRAQLAPMPDDAADMQSTVERLVAACQAKLDAAGVNGRATIQGSIAKKTWLAGSTDADVFLLLDPAIDAGQLEHITRDVAAGVLDNPQGKYAQHPYVIGTFEGLQVDLVPAYDVGSASRKMSAVDRTPFHTAWVQENLSDAQRADVRFAKKWCQGVGVYGAETSIGGFSGYLLEVLVGVHETFAGLVNWLAGGANPRRLALGEDTVEDTVSPLIVVDPVDSARNCAAAVRQDTLALAVEAAQAWIQAPAERFLHPVPVQPKGVQELCAQLRDSGRVWLGLELTPQTERLDLVLPQFQRGARMLAQAMERAGFVVHETGVSSDERPWVGMQWLLDAKPLPATVTHRGPSLDAPANAQKFRKKWAEHPDCVGEVEERDGALQVTLRQRHRHPADWLEAQIKAPQLPKHVTKALPTAVVHRVPAVPSLWAPAVTQFIDGLRPWQRT